MAIRRTQIIANAFGERSVRKLMYALSSTPPSGGAESRSGELEQRQLRAIRDELGHAHAERVALAVTPDIRRRLENFDLTDERSVAAFDSRSTISEWARYHHSRNLPGALARDAMYDMERFPLMG